jgi:hypothetical protein
VMKMPKTPAEEARSMLEVAFDDLLPKMKVTVDVAKRSELDNVRESVEMAQTALEEAKRILEARR